MKVNEAMKDHKDCAVIKIANTDNVLRLVLKEVFTEVTNRLEVKGYDIGRTEIIHLTVCILHSD